MQKLLVMLFFKIASSRHIHFLKLLVDGTYIFKTCTCTYKSCTCTYKGTCTTVGIF